MTPISNKVLFAILGALIVPLFGRLALHGTAAAYDFYRYLIPFMVGGVSGFFIGLMKDNLLKNKEKFQYLVENTSDWIWEVDLAGKYTYVSPKIKDFLGYTPKEGIGKTPFDFMPPDEQASVGKTFKESIASCKPFKNLKNINRHKDGHLIVLETSGVPTFNKKGNLTGYRGIDRDITERTKTEKEKLKLINDLQNALDNVKMLSGLVPICSQCKKIRDDKGYWNHLESYIEKHSDVSFSHGLCMDCAEELYGSEDWYAQNSGK